LAPASVAKVDAVPPALSTARALTGMPPLAATTARFISRPTAMTAAPGIHRLTVRNIKSNTYEAMSSPAPIAQAGSVP